MFKNNGEILLRNNHFIVIIPKAREHNLSFKDGLSAFTLDKNIH